MKKKGFTLVELMVVVAIVAILAAVALPMYSTFKQKGKVSTALKGLSGAQSSLQDWFENNASFSRIDTVPSSGGALRAGSTRVGAGLPEVPHMDWILESAGTSTIILRFDFQAESGCPDSSCDGTWSLTCDSENDKCDVRATIGASSDPLGLNINLDL